VRILGRPSRAIATVVVALLLTSAWPWSGVQAATVTLVGAGDIASCTGSGDSATAAVVRATPGTVFTTGDNAYQDGTPAQFRDCYDPTWGTFRDRTRPAPGNHDYHTSGAAGYFDYFGARAGDPRRGYYAYDLGAWRIYVLNSNCAAVGGCAAGSRQERWLRADLAAHPHRCVLAYWHHPLFSSGPHGNQAKVRAFWQALYAAHADIVINGHDHIYERFRRQSPSGTATARGIQEFVVGTGGVGHYEYGTIKPNSLARNRSTFGVLRLQLSPTGWSWRFMPVAGKTYTDAGSRDCR